MTSRELGNFPGSLRSSNRESAYVCFKPIACCILYSTFTFGRLQIMVRSTDTDLGDWSHMTGPRTLPVWSRAGRRSRNNEAAQRHLGKTKTQESGNPGADWWETGKPSDKTTVPFWLSSYA
ncbi:uncharacterized protein AKAW2_50493A [Aspergillus luchuensis]|uniref:Uncharacterized protein n=1 Tax=Aspergillus kawachii TaxID=1069201 RepID=A0A7R7WBZ0_ASPKA|nr:uncharacterized protein AKAW2_50493A [Aspergillus luchuensis]BCS00152.1 hypothetical protein AKAW2_50493A [Aspergillus luchuensis]